MNTQYTTRDGSTCYQDGNDVVEIVGNRMRIWWGANDFYSRRTPEFNRREAEMSSAAAALFQPKEVPIGSRFD